MGLLDAPPSAFAARLARQLFVSVKDYGAVGNGTTDDTVAIQNAINAVQTAGGGVVYLPAGTYRIQPQVQRTTATNVISAEGSALSISASNVVLRGAGRYLTQLKMYGYGGVNLGASWQTVGGNVWRGHGIFIQGAASGSKVTGLIFEDFELCGTAGFTSWGQWTSPANLSSGDGWDLTNKGLNFGGGQHFGDIIIRRCWIHTFRGELIYHGTNGNDLDSALIERCELSDTNGDGHSLGGGVTSQDNYIHDCGGNGIEDTNNATTIPLAYHRNRIENIGLQGISLGQATLTGPWGPVVVADNKLRNCYGGMQIYGLKKVWIHNNLLVDSGQTSLYAGSTSTNGIWLQALPGKPLNDVVVERNTFMAVTAACQHAIWTEDSNNVGMHNVIVRDNVVMVTQEGKNQSPPASYLSGFIGTPKPSEVGIQEFGNKAIGTTYNSTDQMAVVDSLLTTTAATPLVTVRPDFLRAYFVYAYYRVTVATTNLALTLTFYDGGGTAQTITLLAATNVPVGSYSIAPVFVTAQSADNSQYLTVTATAGTAGQVFVSATIREA